MIEIEASVLSADFMRLGEQAREAEMAGVDGIQIDIMDGRFVPNITFGPDIVWALRNEVKVKIDAHLMIVEPERYIKEFSEAGADRLFVHQEACTHLDRSIETIRELGMEAGVAINPGTSLKVLEEVLDLVDIIQIMTVNPGFGGQEFIASQVDKIRRLRAILDERGYNIPIAVDGGINTETAPLVVSAGATVLVAGSSIYNDKASVAQNVKALRASIEKM
ncbi:MAG TPA: ribulose-phosphate 3-epimerase [Desulfatiglandales bacterium]|nr:ribulose-phosphate 3-epimerase [Desulfatiglandales bacterium]